MSADASSPVSDKGRLLFGAGFAFGVMFTMFVLAVVATSVVDRPGVGLFASEVMLTIAAGVLFTGILGISLYLLAFPENRLALPVEDLVGPKEDGDE